MMLINGIKGLRDRKNLKMPASVEKAMMIAMP